MKFLRDLSVAKKLIVAFLFVGVIPMVVIGINAVATSEDIIHQQVSNQLAAVRTIKANEVERYFDRVRNQVATLSANPVVVDAAKSLPRAFASYSQQATSFSVDTAGQRAQVKNYYHDEFAPQYRSINGQTVDVEPMYRGLDAESWALQ